MDDLVVVGAGPYGLSVAAHAAAAGLSVRVLGRPMASWRDNMPDGMYLKSEPWSSSLSDPSGAYTLAAYCAARNLPAGHGSPLPVGTFAAYGCWFAARAVPGVEERTVTAVLPRADGYVARTDDGEDCPARTVALAPGVLPFVRVPRPLRGLPSGTASHSSHHRDLSVFRGRDVTVIGAGQAALETAALLAERGARPRIVARAGYIDWNSPPQPLERGVLRSLCDPHCGLGTGWPTWVWSETPGAVRRLPAALRTHIAATAMGPAGAWWLRERVEAVVPRLLGHRLRAAEPIPGGARLHLVATGGRAVTVETEHVIAATGFVPDLGRLGLLDASLRGTLRTVRGSRAPVVSPRFESARPGLFFAGLLTAPSFGPAMRFVHGASFTAGRLLQGVQRRLGDRAKAPVAARGPVPVPVPPTGCR